MGGEVEIYQGDGVPALADDTLIAVARMAEARIDAVIKIKQLALKVTNPRDWCDQQGNPYLQVSGAEKIANLFNISWSFLTPEPVIEQEEGGHFTCTFRGRFSMGGRSIEVEGSRSSKDSFFKQNLYEDGKLVREKSVDERDNGRDVKMAALTNMLGNGITRLLGIRNLTWADLEAFAGIKKDEVGKVEYKTKGTKSGSMTPGSKAETSGTKAEHTKEMFDALVLKYSEATSIPVPDVLYAWTKFVGKDGKEGGYRTTEKLAQWQISKAYGVGEAAFKEMDAADPEADGH